MSEEVIALLSGLIGEKGDTKKYPEKIKEFCLVLKKIVEKF